MIAEVITGIGVTSVSTYLVGMSWLDKRYAIHQKLRLDEIEREAKEIRLKLRDLYRDEIAKKYGTNTIWVSPEDYDIEDPKCLEDRMLSDFENRFKPDDETNKYKVEILRGSLDIRRIYHRIDDVVYYNTALILGYGTDIRYFVHNRMVYICAHGNLMVPINEDDVDMHILTKIGIYYGIDVK